MSGHIENRSHCFSRKLRPVSAPRERRHSTSKKYHAGEEEWVSLLRWQAQILTSLLLAVWASVSYSILLSLSAVLY
jgi:hypothetical protein